MSRLAEYTQVEWLEACYANVPSSALLSVVTGPEVTHSPTNQMTGTAQPASKQ